jgi:hypothetical protein
MSGVFKNIDLPPTHRPASVYGGTRTHSLGGEGVVGHYLEDARHCSVLYIRKYFVIGPSSNIVHEANVEQ